MLANTIEVVILISCLVSALYLNTKVKMVGGWKAFFEIDPVIKDSLIFTAAILGTIFAMAVVFA